MTNKRTWNQCGKKNRYRDEHTANLYRRKCEMEHGVKLDYYWCAYCNGFHLTSEEFRPEGYGLTVIDEDTYIYMRPIADVDENRMRYVGKKNRRRIGIKEFERMLAIQEFKKIYTDSIIYIFSNKCYYSTQKILCSLKHCKKGKQHDDSFETQKK